MRSINGIAVASVWGATAALFAAVLLTTSVCTAANGAAAAPVGEPVLEPPTLRSLGVYWIIRGDEDRKARVEMDIRPAGGKEWKKAAPLLRVEKASQQPAKLEHPADL
jgi:hypothetical protein